MALNSEKYDFDIPVKELHQVSKNIAKFKEKLEADPAALNLIEGIDIYNTKRWVDDVNISSDNIVCTTYFTSKLDPQRNLFVEIDDIKYVKPWYESMLTLNLHGIIFYENLSIEFVKKYETDKIKFVKCILGDYSLNDERFIIYQMFFLKRPFKKIFLTDGNDVTINPGLFEFVETKPKEMLFVGRGQENKIIHSPWNLNSVAKLEGNLKINLPNNFYEMAIYNAGVIGGSYHTILFFLRHMNRMFFVINKGDNNNMAAMHYTVFNYFFPNCRKMPQAFIYNLTSKKMKLNIKKILVKFRLGNLIKPKISYENDTISVAPYIFSGYPLNSKFNKFDNSSDAYFIHK